MYDEADTSRIEAEGASDERLELGVDGEAMEGDGGPDEIDARKNECDGKRKELIYDLRVLLCMF